MMDFENDLREELKRREPPRDLTSGVMARIARDARPQPRFAWRPLVAIAAAVVVMFGGLEQYQQYRKGQEAKQQLMLALEITAQKLAAAQEKVGELNRRRIGHEQ